MKKLLLLFVLTAAVTMNSFAQDKASDLKKLFQLMNSEQMIDGVFNNMIPMLKQQASEQLKGSEAKEKLDGYVDFMMKEAKEMTSKLINEDMLNIYDKIFTAEEIKEMIKFYESPIGKKTIEITPELTKELMNAMMTKYVPEFQEKLIKQLDALKK